MRFFDNSSLPERKAATLKRHDVHICDCGAQAWAHAAGGNCILVSFEDRLLLESYWWTCISKGNQHYAESPTAAAQIGGLRYLHQNIAIPARGFIIDHKDGDGLNNMRSNLRDATKTTNSQNSRRRKGSTSPFKGVKVDSRPLGKRFGARLVVDGKVRWLGRFSTAEEAARAYDAAAIAAFGEFARTNFREGER